MSSQNKLKTLSGTAILVILSLSIANGEERPSTKGNCPECKAGESAVENTVIVGPGDYVYENDPGCSQNMSESARQAGRLAADYALPGLSAFAGPLVDQATNEVSKFINSNIHGDIGRLLSPYTNPRANCTLVTLLIPAKAEYSGFRIEAWDGANGNQPERCTAGQDCAGGWCKFTSEPVVNRLDETTLVYVTFKNWSHNRDRAARLTVYFKRPADAPEPR
jgi:hypothetical protein